MIKSADFVRAQVTGTTSAALKEYSFEWILQACTPEGYFAPTCDPIRSPIFLVGDNDEYLWNFTIFRNPRDEYVAVISNVNTDPCKIPVQNGVRIEISAEIMFKEQVQNEIKESPSPNRLRWLKYHEFYRELVVKKVDSGCVTEGSISLLGRVFVRTTSINSNTNKNNNEQLKEIFSIGNDLKNLWHTKDFADVVFRTPTKNFPIHESILAANFRTQMSKARENAVDVADADDDVVAAVVEYVYTGQTTSSLVDNGAIKEHKYLQLLRFADQYQLHGLKEACEWTLSLALNLENVSEILTMASFYGANSLKKAATIFVKLHRKELVQNDAFRAAMLFHPDILLDLYSSV